MLQIIAAALIAIILQNNGIETGYGSVPGIVLIVLSGISSALWGILYQCRYHHKRFLEIVRDFFDIRQPIRPYLLAAMFLLIDFGGVVVSGGFRAESIWLPILLFLKALVFG